MRPRKHRRLYECRAEYVYYAYAESEVEAKNYAQEVVLEEQGDLVKCVEVLDRDHPIQQPSDTLVFHSMSRELTLAECLTRLPEDEKWTRLLGSKVDTPTST